MGALRCHFALLSCGLPARVRAARLRSRLMPAPALGSAASSTTLPGKAPRSRRPRSRVRPESRGCADRTTAAVPKSSRGLGEIEHQPDAPRAGRLRTVVRRDPLRADDLRVIVQGLGEVGDEISHGTLRLSSNSNHSPGRARGAYRLEERDESASFSAVACADANRSSAANADVQARRIVASNAPRSTPPTHSQPSAV